MLKHVTKLLWGALSKMITNINCELKIDFTRKVPQRAALCIDITLIALFSKEVFLWLYHWLIDLSITKLIDVPSSICKAVLRLIQRFSFLDIAQGAVEFPPRTIHGAAMMLWLMLGGLMVRWAVGVMLNPMCHCLVGFVRIWARRDFWWIAILVNASVGKITRHIYTKSVPWWRKVFQIFINKGEKQLLLIFF